MTTALVFGYNEYAMQIAKHLSGSYATLHIYTLDEASQLRALKSGFDASLFDFGDEWDDLVSTHDMDQTLIFCALDDDAENIFLTISLRASFEKVYIISLAKNQESANKLKMAGADKVLPVLQMTSNVIVEILEKPVVTNVLHEILYEKGDLQIAQITIGETSSLIGKRMHDIVWNEEYGVIVLAIVDLELQSTFIFTAKGYNHHIDPGDILVVVGYHEQIRSFEQQIGGYSDIDWHHRSR